jgi:hypothetical protein
MSGSPCGVSAWTRSIHHAKAGLTMNANARVREERPAEVVGRNYF